MPKIYIKLLKATNEILESALTRLFVFACSLESFAF